MYYKHLNLGVKASFTNLLSSPQNSPSKHTSHTLPLSIPPPYPWPPYVPSPTHVIQLQLLVPYTFIFPHVLSL